MSSRKDVDAKINEIQSKIDVEKKVFEGATAMLTMLTDQNARDQCEMKVIDSQRRLEFLEAELSKLSLKKGRDSGSAFSLNGSTGNLEGNSNWKKKTMDAISASHESLRVGNSKSNRDSKGGLLSFFRSNRNSSSALAPKLVAQSIGSLNSLASDSSQESRSGFDSLKYNTNLTSEKLKYRIDHIKEKIELEHKVTEGTENLLTAISRSNDNRTRQDLEFQLREAKDKIGFLKKGLAKYSGLSVVDDEEEKAFLHERKTGRLKLELCGATNVPGKRSANELFYVVLRVDSQVKGTSKATLETIEEFFDIQVDKANEIELCIYSITDRTLMSVAWFHLHEIEEDLKTKFGDDYLNRIHGTSDVEECWLDMEPGGQILLKVFFLPVTRSKTEADQVFRRAPVQKVYPRNGHRFMAQQAYTIMQCAVCKEFMSGQSYQCMECQYACHPRCYESVITKCIPLDQVRKLKLESKDPNVYNTGQLLKYNIPHRFENATNLSAAWCLHCGSMLPVGRKVIKCSECSCCAHKQCFEMAPNFCGLKPDVAKVLVQAFEEHERKMHQKELDEAEDHRRSESNSTTAPVAIIPNPSLVPPSRGQSLGVAKTNVDANVLAQIAYQKKLSIASAQVKPVSPRAFRLDDFDLVAVLGRGAFGKVMLVRERQGQSLYAMKALKKEFIIQNDDVPSIKLEKRVFQQASAAKHPFLVNLHSCFQTETRIYFVMEYISGGDLMAHMMAQKRFPPNRIKFYACEVLLALEYLHEANIVYRDLKLENILMTPQGHIKLADYGICKENMGYGNVTRTFCGTPDYMAPEILLNQKYGRAVDWWSFGILIFVMSAGRYPFHGQDEKDVLDAILSDYIPWPSSITRDSKDIISAFLVKNPNRRLGGGKMDAQEVKCHPYFYGIDWNEFMTMQAIPPWKPEIANEIDVSNFDREFTSERPVLTPMQSILSKVDQDNFADFNYVSDWARMK